MRILKRQILVDFKRRHAEVSSQVDAWEAEVNSTNWNTPMDIKKRYASASILAENHVIFDFKGNKFRLAVQVNYKNSIVLIKKAGTHNEYTKWKLY